MAEILNFIWGWLESGYNLAIGHAKFIWNETKAIFKMATDALESICQNFEGRVSVTREITWRDDSGVETGRERFDFQFRACREQSSRQGIGLPSDPKERIKMRRAVRDQSREKKFLCGKLMKFFGDLEELMTDDEQHNKQKETDENLNQLIQGEETQELRKVLKALFPSQAETEEPR